VLVSTAGSNEVGLWPLPVPEGGACLRCFRVVDVADSRVPSAARPSAPRLVEVPPNPPRGPAAWRLASAAPPATLAASSASVRAFAAQICHGPTAASAGTGPGPGAAAAAALQAGAAWSYLLTAGDDHQVRHWDAAAPGRCFVFCGLPYAQHRPTFAFAAGTGGGAGAAVVNPWRATRGVSGGSSGADDGGSVGSGGGGGGSGGSLLCCYDTVPPSSAAILQAQVPSREGRGPGAADAGAHGGILDIKVIDAGPRKMLVTAGRDGDIKLWR